MKGFFALGLMIVATGVGGEPVAGSLDVRWSAGAEDCESSPQKPLQVHPYESQTFILRQSPCAHFEANFLYLLVGSERALLIDTGAVEDAQSMPLAATILELSRGEGGAKIPLLVVHTHGHGDHHAGDAQLASLADASVQIAPLESTQLRKFLGFTDWPNGIARVDLGGRTVEVIAVPGHQEDHLLFYDDRTGLVFSGDFLLAGRLMISDATAYRQSAVRAIEFLATRPVTHILGGHIELDAAGQLYSSGAHYHPDERPLDLRTEDLLALPAALDHFNGFYAKHPSYVLTHPLHNLIAVALAAAAALILAVLGVRRLLRRRRRAISR